MTYFLLVIPSVVLFFTVFLVMCRQRFNVAEVIAAGFTANLISAAIHANSNIMPQILDADILGNLTIAGCLSVLSYRKTKSWLLSGHYVFLAMVTGLVGGNLVGVFITLNTNDNMFSITITVMEP